MTLEFKKFQKYPQLRYGISEKKDGPMKLSSEGHGHASNRTAFFKKLGVSTRQLATPIQTHSDRVAKIDADRLAKPLPATDGLVTKLPNIFLTVSVADCFPVYFFDSKTGFLGLAHCGWRGIIKNLPEKVVSHMQSNPSKILVGIGPGIQSCHFEIQADVLPEFISYPEAIKRRGRKIFVDLPRIIKIQLVAAGLNPKNIENCGECTFCQKNKYFSFRRDKPPVTEVMMAYIGLL